MTGYENHDTAELKRLLAEPDDYIGPPVKRRIREELASRSRDKPEPIKNPSSDQQVGEPVEITLPWDVLVSKNDRQNPHSGVGITRAWRRGLKRCRNLARQQYAGEPLEGDVIVRFTFYPPSRRPDLPNYLALPLDALQGVVYHNDRQANAGGGWRWGYIDKLEPRVEVSITSHTPTDSAVEPNPTEEAA